MGELSMTSAVARGDCEVDQLSRQDLKRLMNQHPTLSDLILLEASRAGVFAAGDVRSGSEAV
jgi:CRP-like cAMP-binding protein